MKKLSRMACFSAALVVGAVSFSPSPVHAGTGSAAAPAAESLGAGTPQGPVASTSADGEEVFTFTARSTAPGAKSAAADRITCKGAYRGGKYYDAPHPGASSKKRRINAHLSVTCTGGGAGATHVTVASRMVDGRRAGKVSTDKGFRSAKTGGDLACVSSKRGYQGKGYVYVKFPPRYSPPAASLNPVSIIKAFKKGKKGICVKA
ncbi:hypothetical protein GCM10009678_13760 [Actinomadura kijaniata]|uniref:Uncharacterized protein n=1 Tax=Actinomadura namibiensis TaxID=182080 RepID=A0A7W3LQX6_ACTNM|nr:hypothetical protein [Actinomadura namibiensis]MBA8952545.1 hypothetical protein [Actinomadura namibiensis]